MAPRRLSVLTADAGLGLGRTGRRIVVSIVVAALLLVVGGVVVALRWERIKAWADAPAVLDAERTAESFDLPAGVHDDPTLGACDVPDTVRCGWTATSPREAVVAVAGALEEAGLDVDDVVCDNPDLPVSAMDAVVPCAAAARLSGATLWVLATDRTPQGDVPFGRTSVWLRWDSMTITGALSERLWAEMPVIGGRPITAVEARAVLPARLAAAVGTGCAADQPGCLAWEAPIDVTGLGDEPAATLVRELVDAGLFPVRAGVAGTDATVAFATGLIVADGGGRPGLFVVVRKDPDGGLMASVNSF